MVFPNYLYPAMPFTSYTKLTYPDVMAIKAYLFSLPPVNVQETKNTLVFSVQPAAGFCWAGASCFSMPGRCGRTPAGTRILINGAYLAEALGHCGECHTPRNIMSGLILSKSYAGGADRRLLRAEHFVRQDVRRWRLEPGRPGGVSVQRRQHEQGLVLRADAASGAGTA